MRNIEWATSIQLGGRGSAPFVADNSLRNQIINRSDTDQKKSGKACGPVVHDKVHSESAAQSSRNGDLVVGGVAIEFEGVGPWRGPAVVLLTSSRSLSPFERVCQRLHVASLRTVVVIVDRRMTAEMVVQRLQSAGVQTAVLVGDHVTGQLAWRLAAAYPYRFIGLVVIDACHPGVPGQTDAVIDKRCPAVEVNTTVIVTDSCATSVARASQRFVYGDFRLVTLCTPCPTVQLSVEIVLRAVCW